MKIWPFVKRQKVLIFGVGSGGISFFERNKNRYEIIGFLDNGKCKHGSSGIQIISATLMDEWREVANC